MNNDYKCNQSPITPERLQESFRQIEQYSLKPSVVYIPEHMADDVIEFLKRLWREDNPGLQEPEIEASNS